MVNVKHQPREGGMMVSRTLKLLALGAVVAFVFASEQAFAQTVTTTFQVSATINANCLQQAATNIDHGVYDPLAGDDDATGAITVRCTKGTPYTVALNVGTGGGSFVTRTLDGGGGETLGFNLYTTAARNVIWGDGTNTSQTVPGTGAGLGIPETQSHTVYSRIPTGQTTAAPSTYSSTIQVSITY
jgi:spore coat protein U-like protein